MATKKLKLVEKALTEDQLKEKILRLEQVKADIKVLEKEETALSAKLAAELGVGTIRQYDGTRCTIVQNMGRGIKWKDEAGRLASLMYPTTKKMRIYLRWLARTFPKVVPSKAYVKISQIKDGDEES